MQSRVNYFSPSLPLTDRSPFAHLDSRFERGEFQRRQKIFAREVDDTYQSPLAVISRTFRSWKENMSGQTIRRSRVAAYLGKGSSFFPWRILGFIRYIYIYVNYSFSLQVIREFEIVVEEELDLQFEFILAPKGPVSLGFRDRS